MSSKDEEARKLAESHYRIEPGMTRIFRVKGNSETEASANEPIKLLEVNENTIACGILPLKFDPEPENGLSSSTVIVEVTPEEYDQIACGNLELPHDWTLGELLPKPTATGVE
ncbi:MAG: hypothetical protein NVSMB14_05940 [Isosphaeraceae bacterium]